MTDKKSTKSRKSSRSKASTSTCLMATNGEASKMIPVLDDAEYEFTAPLKGCVSALPVYPGDDAQHGGGGISKEKGIPSNRSNKSSTTTSMPLLADDRSVNSARLEDLLCPITLKISAARRHEEDEMLAGLIIPNSKHSMFSDTTEKTSTPTSGHSSYSNGSSEGASGSDEEEALSKEKEDKKKKKKKKNKSKKSDKKIKKEKRKEKKDNKKEDEAPMTVSEENLVEELCGFLSDTLSTTHNKESFLRLLISGDGSDQAQSTVPPHAKAAVAAAAAEEFDAGYTTFQSPANSICDSTTSYQSTLSKLYCMFPVDASPSIGPESGSNWSVLDPPSHSASTDPCLASPISIKKAKLARMAYRSKMEAPQATKNEGEYDGEDTPRSTESEQTKVSNSSDRTKKRSNCASDRGSASKSIREENSQDFDGCPSKYGVSTPSDRTTCVDTVGLPQVPIVTSTAEARQKVSAVQPVGDNSSPEELFLALPPEFRSYLLGLHAEEMQGGQKTKDIEEMLMQPPVLEIPMIQDEGTISSDLTGFTGMTGSVIVKSRPPEFIVSGVKKPSSPKPPVAYIQQGRFPPQSSTARRRRPSPAPPIDLTVKEGEKQDDSSVDSDGSNDEDDDDEESDGDIPDLASIATSVYSHHHMRPNRSAMYVATPSTCSVVEHTPDNVKKVCFHIVHVREYDTIIDCNPSCSQGPALSLGWKKISDSIYLLDEYDAKHRRVNDELILSSEMRESILSKLGYTGTDIAASVRKIMKVRNQRRRTSKTVRVQNLEFAMERVGKRFKHLLRGGGGSNRKVAV